MEQPAGLTSVLLDPHADISDKDDAAMDLGRHDEPEALTALLRVGRDETESEIVLWSIGESIAEILLRNGRTWCPGIDDLAAEARFEFDRRIGVSRTSEPPA